MRKIQLLIIVSILLLTAGYSSAQGNKFKVSEKSTMLIEGTSNLRDWGVEIPIIKGEAVVEGNNIETFAFTIKVNDMKGTVSGMMDHVKKALKADANPEIRFSLAKPGKLENGKSKAEANITAAGKTKLFEIEGNVKKEGNTYVITGSKAMKMTDFGIDPPKALLGTVKAADAVNVKFEVILNQ